jgi:small subunit ribosomal protein S20
MPNIKSAMKEYRKNVKRRSFNKNIKTHADDLIKKSRKAIVSKNAKSADLVKQAMKALDKAAQKGVIKKNAAARYKSRLNLALNKSTKK